MSNRTASYREEINKLSISHFAEEAQKTLEESMAMSIDERQELALELYRSRHGLSSTTALNPTGTIGRNKNGTTSKKSSASTAALGKSPPRPSPASVAYHSDEESLKCYDENPDDSSVTEKPSEVSSSDSQVSSMAVKKSLKKITIVDHNFSNRKVKTKA